MRSSGMHGQYQSINLCPLNKWQDYISPNRGSPLCYPNPNMQASFRMEAIDTSCRLKTSALFIQMRSQRIERIFCPPTIPHCEADFGQIELYLFTEGIMAPQQHADSIMRILEEWRKVRSRVGPGDS